MAGSEGCPDSAPDRGRSTYHYHVPGKVLASKLSFQICLLVLLWPLPATSQVQDLYRITGGSFADHVEYHHVDLPPGKDLVLATSPARERSPTSITQTTVTRIGRRERVSCIPGWC